jgi:hypothetical protein
MNKKPDSQKIAHWIKIKLTVTNEFYRILSARRIFNRYKEIVLANEGVNIEGAQFHNWIIHNYASSLAMAIRRQTDTDNDVHSLAKLIKEIHDNPAEIQRTWYRELWRRKGREEIASIADAEFTRLAGGGAYFNPSIADDDLIILHQVSERIVKLADRAVAHSSKQPIPSDVGFEEMDECLEAFKGLLQKYILLLEAVGNYLEPTPAIDWEEIFTRAWITTDEPDARG